MDADAAKSILTSPREAPQRRRPQIQFQTTAEVEHVPVAPASPASQAKSPKEAETAKNPWQQRARVSYASSRMDAPPTALDSISSLFSILSDTERTLNPIRFTRLMQGLRLPRATNTTAHQLVSDADKDGSQSIELNELEMLLVSLNLIVQPPEIDRDLTPQTASPVQMAYGRASQASKFLPGAFKQRKSQRLSMIMDTLGVDSQKDKLRVEYEALAKRLKERRERISEVQADHLSEAGAIHKLEPTADDAFLTPFQDIFHNMSALGRKKGERIDAAAIKEIAEALGDVITETEVDSMLRVAGGDVYGVEYSDWRSFMETIVVQEPDD